MTTVTAGAALSALSLTCAARTASAPSERRIFCKKQCLDSLVHFNDLCRSFTDLRAVIVKARVLALSDTERQRAAATVERWLLVEVERERAAAKAAAGDKRATYNLSPGAPDETAAAPMRLAA